ncbi:MAG TPA: Lsr2 family protein [Pseudonocardiaceae bacterium]|nr:Lsr2 family protein [Pseudonocardiaceae bacterium]
MAQKTIVHLIDDVDGGEADETVTFSLDGIEYTIDLSSGNANELRSSLGEFVEAARRTGGKSAPAKAAKSGAASDRAENQAIREWARNAGHQVSERGRIPADIVNQFRQAQHA